MHTNIHPCICMSHHSASRVVCSRAPFTSCSRKLKQTLNRRQPLISLWLLLFLFYLFFTHVLMSHAKHIQYYQLVLVHTHMQVCTYICMCTLCIVVWCLRRRKSRKSKTSQIARCWLSAASRAVAVAKCPSSSNNRHHHHHQPQHPHQFIVAVIICVVIVIFAKLLMLICSDLLCHWHSYLHCGPRHAKHEKQILTRFRLSFTTSPIWFSKLLGCNGLHSKFV